MSMNLRDSRIFVSGGSGVIGRELVLKLHQRGAKVFVGDLKPRPAEWPADIRYRQGDLNYIDRRELREFNPTGFFHLAATFERAVENFEFWEENYHHNVRLSNHLVSLLKDLPALTKVIFASCYLVYDPALYIYTLARDTGYRLLETDPVCPRNLVGAAKMYHEQELQFLQGFDNHKFKSISARIFRSYGKESKDIISRWIRMLLNGEQLEVYRKEGIFDYIYAGDVAEGLVKMYEHEKAEGVYNLGTDHSRKVSDVLKILKSHFPEMLFREVDSGILFEASQANMDRFVQELEWKPETSLEQSVPMLIQHEMMKHHAPVSTQANSGVLVTSISGKIPLLKAVKHAARKLDSSLNVHGADVNAYCLGRHFVDHFWQMPHMDALKINDVVRYCHSNNIKAIIPTRDGELMYWAVHKEELAKAGVHLMISTPAGVECCLDKLQFYRNLDKKGLPVIATMVNIEDLDCERFVVKERYGAGAQKVGLNLPKDQAIGHATTLDAPIFQPYVAGTEISVDAYIAKTDGVKGIVCRYREVVRHGESQVTTTFHDAALESLSAKLVQELGLYGHAVLQLIRDGAGRFHIIECNSRFGGASTLSIAAGLDSFYWFLLESTGVDIVEYPFLKPEKPLTQIRFPEDIIV